MFCAFVYCLLMLEACQKLTRMFWTKTDFTPHNWIRLDDFLGYKSVFGFIKKFVMIYVQYYSKHKNSSCKAMNCPNNVRKHKFACKSMVLFFSILKKLPSNALYTQTAIIICNKIFTAITILDELSNTCCFMLISAMVAEKCNFF